MEGEANLPPSSSRTSLKDLADSESTTSVKGMGSSETSNTAEINITGEERSFLFAIYSIKIMLNFPAKQLLLGFRKLKILILRRNFEAIIWKHQKHDEKLAA